MFNNREKEGGNEAEFLNVVSLWLRFLTPDFLPRILRLTRVSRVRFLVTLKAHRIEKPDARKKAQCSPINVSCAAIVLRAVSWSTNAASQNFLAATSSTPQNRRPASSLLTWNKSDLFHVNRHDAGRRKVVRSLSLEEIILNVVAGRTESSTRTHVSVNHQTVGRVLKSIRLRSEL
ncbi:hypothetical protein TNCV_3821351 [Trichonephila clavipes]|nr:hypothetical protein TNCV_3821351 [Trichonephila clavipes]